MGVNSNNSGKKDNKKKWLGISALSSFVLYAVLSFVAIQVTDEAVSNALLVITKVFLMAFIVLGFIYYIHGAKDNTKQNIYDKKTAKQTLTPVYESASDKSEDSRAEACKSTTDNAEITEASESDIKMQAEGNGVYLGTVGEWIFYEYYYDKETNEFIEKKYHEEYLDTGTVFEGSSVVTAQYVYGKFVKSNNVSGLEKLKQIMNSSSTTENN